MRLQHCTTNYLFAITFLQAQLRFLWAWQLLTSSVTSLSAPSSPILLNDINLVLLRYNSGTIKMLNSNLLLAGRGRVWGLQTNLLPSCTKRTITWTVITYISSSCESQGSITVLFSVIKCIHSSPKNTGHWAVSICLHILYGIFQQTPVLCSNCRK